MAATVILQVAGHGLGGAFGGAVGAALGGYVDSQIVLPIIFPQSDFKGPRLQDLRLSSGDEGAGMTIAIGRAVRMAGVFTWISNLIEKEKTSGGGAFGLLPETTEFRYFVDFDLALCDNRVESVEKILADGKVIFQSGIDEIEVVSNGISIDISFNAQGFAPSETGIVDQPGGVLAGATTVHVSNLDRGPIPITLGFSEIFTVLGEQYRVIGSTYDSETKSADIVFTPPAQQNWPNGTEVKLSGSNATGVRTIVTSTDPGADLTLFPSGSDILMSGWTNPVNNGIFNVGQRQRIDANTTELILRTPSTVEAPSTVPEAAGNTITIIASAVRGSRNFALLTFYQGTADQPADPYLESILGVGNVPAYRGHTHVVVRQMRLHNFANQMPNMEFIVSESGIRTVPQAISFFLERGGLRPEEYDVSALPPTLFEGMGLKGLQALGQTLQPIMIAYDLAARDERGKLKFYERKGLPVVALTAGELGVTPSGSLFRFDPVEWAGMRDDSLPSEVNVRYDDPARDLQTGVQPARAQPRTKEAPDVIDLAQTLTTSQAKAAAERLLWSTIYSSITYRTALPPSRLLLLEHDLVDFPYKGGIERGMVTKVDRGENFVVEIEALRHADLSGQNAPSDAPLGHPSNDPTQEPDDDPTAPNDPADATLEIFDWAPLRNADADDPGIYVGVTDQVPGVPWPGATIHESTDGINFTQVGSAPVEAITGRATTELATAPSPWLWDRANSVTVELLDGALTSITEDQVLSGGNRALIGGEVVGFATATLVGTRTYQISTLLRGLRNTESLMDSHVPGDRFVLLSAPGTMDFLATTASMGALRRYAAVPEGRDLDTNFLTLHQHQLGTLRAFSPHAIRGERNTSGDLTVTWFRRSRLLSRIFGPGAAPLVEPEAYEVEFVSSSGSILRTASVSAPAIVYTAAEQSADGLSPGVPVKVRAYQLSSVGRGRVGEETV